MRAYVEAVVFVALWIALGFGLRLDANAYLLAGVPLTVAFQRVVARRPLRAAWLREAPTAHLDRRWAAIFLSLAAFPATFAVRAVVGGERAIALWAAAAVVGAGAAAYSIRNRRPGMLREILRCLATGGLIGTGLIVILAVMQRTAAGVHPDGARFVVALRTLALYFPVCFVLEEVTFRGVLDAHVARGERQRWRSAVSVSALWGVWHLPVVHAAGSRAIVVAVLLVVHIAIGVPLSFAWRRSGNLAVPALTHAVIDTIRNALVGA